MFRNKKNYNIFFILLVMIAFSACKSKTAGNENKQGGQDTTVVVNGDTTRVINYDSPTADEKIMLQFNPAPGTTFYVTNNTTYTAYQSIDSTDMHATSIKYVKVKVKIISREENKTKMEFTVVDSRKTVKDDSSTIDYAYGKPMADKGDDLDRQIEDCLVNAPLVITMTDDGVGTDIQGYDAIINKIKTLVKDQMGTDVPDEYIASQIGTPTDNLENFFISYPDSAVKIGDTWHFSTKSVLQGVPITMTNHYVLADRKNGIAYINFNTEVEIDKSQMSPEVIKDMVNLKFSAYIKGTGEIDEKTGWPMLMKISQSLSVADIFQGHPSKSTNTSNGVLRSTM